MEPRMFDKFLAAAVKAGASDIHMKAGAQPTLRVHGVLKEVKLEALTPEGMEGLVRHLLASHGLEMDMRRLREYDTSYVVDGVGRFRVNILKQKGYFAAVLRVIPSQVPSLDELGLPGVLKKIAREERGLVLVTGVTGSGKSTTLAAMINEVNQEYRKHIVTIEDPIEFLHTDRLSRITQREVGADTESFAMALRAALRQDPDVILVGEMRDAVTIDTGLKAAETGHLVFSTVHTNDAAGAVTRLADMGLEGFLTASSVIGILAQRLVRKVCPDCAVGKAPDPSLIERLSGEDDLPPGDYRVGEGCESCNMTGYRGRVGIFELIVMTDRIRKLVLEQTSAGVIRDAAMAEGMRTLRQDGIAKVRQGVTTLSEVLRVTQDE